MEIREFITGRGERLADVVQRPPGRDARFIMLGILVFAVVADIVVLMVRHWKFLSQNRYFPGPVALFAALAVYLIWFWVRAIKDREVLRRYSQEHTGDPASRDMADHMVAVLYRGLLAACMFPWLALMGVHLLLR